MKLLDHFHLRVRPPRISGKELLVALLLTLLVALWFAKMLVDGLTGAN